MEDLTLLARLQRGTTALQLLSRLDRTPTRDRAIQYRCRMIRDLLWQIEMETTPPAHLEEYYDFDQEERCGQPIEAPE